MTDACYSLAIETSGHAGSVCVGVDDTILATCDLTASRRHNVELMPAIDSLFAAQGARPAQLAAIFVSLGPGSFTGLRVALATTKMLAVALGAKVVGVPSLDVLARNAPAPDDPDTTLAVCLNLKRQTMYTGRYRFTDEHWQSIDEPALRTLDDLIDSASQPLWILGHPLPEHATLPSGVQVLDASLAAGRCEHVYALGRQQARLGAFDAPADLLPLYVRPPEAVELWAQRKPR